MDEHSREMAYYAMLRSTPVEQSPDLATMATEQLWSWLRMHKITTLGGLSDHLVSTGDDPVKQAELLHLGIDDRMAMAKILSKIAPGHERLRKFLRELPGTNPDQA